MDYKRDVCQSIILKKTSYKKLRAIKNDSFCSLEFEEGYKSIKNSAQLRVLPFTKTNEMNRFSREDVG